MIRRIYLDNFKCFVNFSLELDDVTLLVGDNGVGKTSVLDAVYAIRQLLTGDARVTDPGIFPTSSLTRFERRDLQTVECELVLPDEVKPLVYRLEIEHDRRSRRARIQLEMLRTSGGEPLFVFERGEVQLYRDDHSSGPSYSADWTESAMARVAERTDNARLCAARRYLRRALICRLNPAAFEAESRQEDAVLTRDASNFASWYRHLFQERQDLYPDYVAVLKEVIDGFQGVRLEQVGQDTRLLQTLFRYDDGPRVAFRLDEISDGQRALLALYALLKAGESEGQPLLLDEPVNYVTLAEIQPWLVALSDACGDRLPQALLCSHHPELIDYFGSEHAVVLRREPSGIVVAEPLQADARDGSLKLSEQFARGCAS